MATTNESTNSSATDKKDGERSPNFPAMTLEEAIQKARALWDAEKRSFAPVKVVYKHWGYSPTSSGARSVLAALNAFGLLDFRGSGDTREGKLSQRALTILIDPDAAPQELRNAAKAPKLYRELLASYPEGFPSDATLRSNLILKRGFNDKTVDSAIRDFKKTMEFAKVDLSGSADDQPLRQPPDQSDVRPRIGDFVQWESQGVMQFVEPRRVAGFSDDGLWAFIEGEKTGVAVSELSVKKIAAAVNAVAPPPAPLAVAASVAPAAAGIKTETFALECGEIMVRFPSRMTADDLENVKEWMRILERKFTKSAHSDESPKP